MSDYMAKAVAGQNINNGAATVLVGQDYDRGPDLSLLSKYDNRIARGMLYWDDMRIPANTINIQGASNKPEWATWLGNTVILRFDPATMEQVFFDVQMPHQWANWTRIHPHVHWVPISNGSAGQDVSWGLEYTWANPGDVFGATTTIYGDQVAPTGTLTANRHCITSLGYILPSGKEDSSMLSCRLFRDATGVGGTDNYPADAGFLEFDIHIQHHVAPGSMEEFPGANDGL